MKLKNIPNGLSLLRLLLCIPLFIMPPFTITYMLLFCVAAVTDFFDGQLARRIRGAASELGATLDSIADVALVSVIIFVIMPAMQLWSGLWLIYVCVLSLKVVASTGIGYVRFREIISLHTISFKLLVTALFLFPLIYYFTGTGLVINVFASVIAASGILIVIEELFIISLLKRPERNIKSIFGVKAANQAVAMKNK
jgi:CDP-diacylglycerol--glycerol-3-phosphate 3-phosphatidyltransferase